jgi:hypothetical protein
VTELAAASSASDPENLEALLEFGGFPEPLLGQNRRAMRLWQRERITRVVHEDLRDLERVKEITLVEQLVDLLPDRIGSLLSLKSLPEDLEVDHKTVDRWIGILERLYVCCRIPPFGSPRIRALKKQQKLYLWDWYTRLLSGTSGEKSFPEWARHCGAVRPLVLGYGDAVRSPCAAPPRAAHGRAT